MGCRFLGVMRGGGTGGAVLSSGTWQKICNHKKVTATHSAAYGLYSTLLNKLNDVREKEQ